MYTTPSTSIVHQRSFQTNLNWWPPAKPSYRLIKYFFKKINEPWPSNGSSGKVMDSFNSLTTPFCLVRVMVFACRHSISTDQALWAQRGTCWSGRVDLQKNRSTWPNPPQVLITWPGLSMGIWAGLLGVNLALNLTAHYRLGMASLVIPTES